MARVILLTGGNLGDVKSRLQCAQQQINEQIGPVLRCSHRYESRPWGFDAETLFSNQGLEADTDLSPDEGLDAVGRIEVALGRDRAAEQAERERTGARYASRTIDIDVLFYDDRVIDTPRLCVPHPRIGEREFVLVPLCEVMRERRHPLTGLTAAEMLEALRQKNRKPCDDESRLS